ncbi:Na+/H+ antiporter NhaC family protein [Planctobacterium marinum]|uniref:Sodium:proton antiporter n=1 Tax=Planctobacterium marinum TaxID=1631968 RepID=A0AA48KPI7_9ALTE|nr:sodium:proton antiporter [Planctobacterium marinum]
MNFSFKAMNKNSAGLFFLVALAAAIYCFFAVPATWKEQRLSYDIFQNDNVQAVYIERGKQRIVPQAIAYESSPLRQAALDNISQAPEVKTQWVYLDNDPQNIVMLKADYHLGAWSLLPAIVAILMCLLTREPVAALLSGILVGAIMLGKFDITGDVLIPSVGTDNAAGILILYLWLLGGLLGMWSKTGAAQAFAEYMTRHFVKGPRSAKFIAWCLGVLFFQGGTMSTVLVGTTVKPMADKAKVSHEEMSYIVDSTASPIASLIAFNAWPAYVQALIFVPGAAFLATEADRIAFFFSSVPFSFYAILAITGTLLVSLNHFNFAGKPLRTAWQRSQNTGELDAPGAKPVSAKELHEPQVPDNYRSSALEFILPLVTLLMVAVLTFVFLGSPKIHWAFGSALGLCVALALFKGMSLGNIMDGFGNGLKGVVVASVVLMLAITIGGISKEIGGGLFLVDLLGQQVPFWALPVILQILTMLIAFSTGTSWGTYAIAFPLAMPLAWAIADAQALANPELFMMICFATVLNGSVFGDQCSPISDTTILSAMTTGCDLMDHVKTQIVPASMAAFGAAILWTMSALLLV